MFREGLKGIEGKRKKSDRVGGGKSDRCCDIVIAVKAEVGPNGKRDEIRAAIASLPSNVERD